MVRKSERKTGMFSTLRLVAALIALFIISAANVNIIHAEDFYDNQGPVDTSINEDEMFNHPHAPGQLIVGYRSEEISGASANKGSIDWEQFGMRMKRIIKKRKKQSVSSTRETALRTVQQEEPPEIILLETIDQDTDLKEIRKQLLNLREIEYVEPNYRIRMNSVPDDLYFSYLDGMHNTGQTGGVFDADIDAPEAWDITTGNQNVLVGIVDTGIDYNHPDLADNIWTNPGEVPDNNVDDDGNGYVDDVYGYDFANNDGDPLDDNFHGTHVSGTVGAVGNNSQGVTGVAWKVKMAALKILDYEGNGYISDAALAMEYANNMGISITNHSWGWTGFSSQALKDEIESANSLGYLFIAASGNGGYDGIGDNNDQIPDYPGSYDNDNIISVAASDNTDDLTSFSNYGPVSVDIAAPGQAIYSTFPTLVTTGMAIEGLYTVNYDTLSGTSMAAPHVTGMAALLKSCNLYLTADEIKEAILGSVDQLESLDGFTLTGGRLNAYQALLACPECASDPPEISSIEDQTISEDFSSDPIPFYVSDAATPVEQLVVTAQSDDQQLVLNSNIQIHGTDQERTITITPEKDKSGACEITLTVQNVASKSASTAFHLTVQETDDPPIVGNPIEDINLHENTEQETLDLSGVFSDIDNDDTAITKTIQLNTNPDLVTPTISGDILTLNYQQDQLGSAQITIRATSNNLTVDDTFIITIEEADSGGGGGGCFIGAAGF